MPESGSTDCCSNDNPNYNATLESKHNMLSENKSLITRMDEVTYSKLPENNEIRPHNVRSVRSNQPDDQLYTAKYNSVHTNNIINRIPCHISCNVRGSVLTTLIKHRHTAIYRNGQPVRCYKTGCRHTNKGEIQNVTESNW